MKYGAVTTRNSRSSMEIMAALRSAGLYQRFENPRTFLSVGITSSFIPSISHLQIGAPSVESSEKPRARSLFGGVCPTWGQTPQAPTKISTGRFSARTRRNEVPCHSIFEQRMMIARGQFNGRKGLSRKPAPRGRRSVWLERLGSPAARARGARNGSFAPRSAVGGASRDDSRSRTLGTFRADGSVRRASRSHEHRGT